jgi:hypothetical protein
MKKQVTTSGKSLMLHVYDGLITESVALKATIDDEPDVIIAEINEQSPKLIEIVKHKIILLDGINELINK